MSSRFFDTNVFVYAFGAFDPRRTVPASEALRSGGGVVSVQVLNEFVRVLRNKQHREWPDIRRALREIHVICSVVDLTLDMHEAALDLAEADNIPIYDALIVAAARAAGCGVLVSEDFQDGRLFGDLRVDNPFAAPAG